MSMSQPTRSEDQTSKMRCKCHVSYFSFLKCKSYSHHGVARPQVADGGMGYMEGSCELNKQPRTADEGWSSSLGVGRGANNPSP